MLYYQRGSETDVLTSVDLKNGILEAFEKIGERKKILAIPPDFTRYHSRAGEITSIIYKQLGDKLADVLPALGTHAGMTEAEMTEMYPGIPLDKFKVHDWRNDVVEVGRVPGSVVKEYTDGMLDYEWPAQLNKLILNGGHDLILSIGQVVPHEVIGMANYNKNLFVGTGGSEGINKSHFAGAVYGMERIMGRAINPVRKLLNYASDHFIKDLPVVYIHTVVGRDDSGKLVTRGLFIGDDLQVFTLAADLSLKVNFTMLDKPLKKVVVYLDPAEFKSTWLGNKSIYRTRMAIADEGELIVLAPALKEFGEDKEIDRLIRKYGYRTTPEVLDFVKKNDDIQNNLSAAAHLIHGSTENRFKVTYCPGKITEEEIRSVNYNYMPLEEAMKKYDPEKLKDGFNVVDGEEIYYISNPAIGLWAEKSRFIKTI
jgi:nickel-dependent lactate racemase